MRTNFVKMSVAAAMLLASSAYAGKIIGVTAGTPHELTEPLPTQYGFGGWNLDNVAVRMVDAETGVTLSADFFNETDGTYDIMTYGESFRSDISTGGEIRGILSGKDWPVGEPSGIKVVNDDTGTVKSGKSQNCIMTTSYLDEVDSKTGESGYLDIYETSTRDNPIAVPTVCSSPFQSHKRFKISMQPTTVAVTDEERYGQPIDLVFNLDETDTNPTARRYQVFQKINNYTGMRLDGYKVELLDENGIEVNASNLIRFSLDLVTDTTKHSDGDENGYQAVFSNGLWGPKDEKVRDVPHFTEDGFFDSKRAGFEQEGNNTQELTGGPTTLGSNYVDLFGLWLPSKWAPKGIFFDDDNDPLTDAELVAFWGTVPNADEGTAPAWHKGQADNWAEPTAEELLTWMTDPLYSQGTIEDTLNLGLNYVVEVGLNSTIGSKFTIRITPRVAPEANQTAPSYIDAEGNYILPPTDYNGTEAVLVISPAPEFTIGADLSVGIADTALNSDPDTNQTYVITLTASNGDEENLTLNETDTNSSIFVGTIGTNSNAVTADGVVNVVNGTIVSVTYKDITKTTKATDGTVTPPPVVPDDYNPSSGGGGCTYNPDSKSFDIGFLLMMAMGLLYPFRRRFIK